MYKNKQVVCKDGFKMSVQANDSAYCSPRINNAERYTSVEIGFPSEKEELIMNFAESADDPTETVYGYVPVTVVNSVLVKHGGMVSGEVPNGIAPIKPIL